MDSVYVTWADLSVSSHTGSGGRWGPRQRADAVRSICRKDTPEQRPVRREGQVNQNGAGAEAAEEQGRERRLQGSDPWDGSRSHSDCAKALRRTRRKSQETGVRRERGGDSRRWLHKGKGRGGGGRRRGRLRPLCRLGFPLPQVREGGLPSISCHLASSLPAISLATI